MIYFNLISVISMLNLSKEMHAKRVKKILIWGDQWLDGGGAQNFYGGDRPPCGEQGSDGGGGMLGNPDLSVFIK